MCGVCSCQPRLEAPRRPAPVFAGSPVSCHNASLRESRRSVVMHPAMPRMAMFSKIKLGLSLWDSNWTHPQKTDF